MVAADGAPIESGGGKYKGAIQLACVMDGWHLAGVELRCHPHIGCHSMDGTFWTLAIENFGAIKIWSSAIYRPLLDGWDLVTC